MTALRTRLREYAAESPGRAALLDPGGGIFSFAELWAELERVEGVLRAAGIGRPDVVAVILPDGLCGLVALVGVAGVCACAPMNPALTAQEVESALLELDVRAVIVGEECTTAARVAKELGCLVVEAAFSEGSCVWTVKQTARRAAAGSGEARSGEDMPILLLPTSGTTGRRKVVPLSEWNLEAMLENTARTLGLTRDDRLLMLARLFHVQGILSPLAQLLAGGSVIMASGFDRGQFNQWIEGLGPTWFTCGPTMHRAVAAHLEDCPLRGPTSLRFARSGGAPLSTELRLRVERALGVPLLNVYGLSEAGAVASTRAGTPEVETGHPGTCAGRSVGPEIAVMNAAGGRLAANEEGEIVVSGPTVMRGYWDDPGSNEEAFFGRWFRTGDLGRLDAEGFLHITGRLKEMINRGGEKISPGEVDAVLAAHAAVLEVAAFGVPHEALGEDVACAVVLRAGFEAGERELRDFAARRLAGYKVPRRVFLVESIPCGATGKPQRLVLRERFSGSRLEREIREDGGVEPAVVGGEERGVWPTDLAESVDLLWHRYLTGAPAGGNTDFFSAGGDSLGATALLTEAEGLFGLKSKLSKGEFIRDPTRRALAGMISRAIGDARDEFGVGQPRDDSSIRVMGVTRGRGRPPLFLVPSDGEEGYCFRRLSKVLGDEWPLSLVRPGGCWHERSASSIADAGRLTAEAIQKAIREAIKEAIKEAIEEAIREPMAGGVAGGDGPVVVGGFCYGGVVAYEAACELALAGKKVLVMLFDVPVPGRPHLLKGWRVILGAVGDGFLDAWHGRNVRPAAAICRKLIRRCAWFAIRRAGPGGGGWWDARLFRWIFEQAQRNYFSFHRLRATKVPVLHFIADFEHDRMMAESRLAWSEVASAGVTIERLPGGHNGLFGDENMRLISRRIESWVERQSSAAEGR